MKNITNTIAIAIICMYHTTLACNDSQNYVLDQLKCDWVAVKPIQRCELYNTAGKQMKNVCQETCDNCPNRSLPISSTCSNHIKCMSNYCEYGICTERSSDGSYCSENVGCKSNVCSNGKCLRKNGDICLTDNTCESNRCSSGLCATKKVNKRKSKIGEPCFKHSGCETNACTNNVCKYISVASVNVKADLGDACFSNQSCTSNYCENSKCRLKPNGKWCNIDNQCASSFCSNNRCIVNTIVPIEADLGGYCVSNTGCKSGYCEINSCKLKPIGTECDIDNQCASSFCFNNNCVISQFLDVMDTDTGRSCSKNNECKSNKCSNGACMAQESCEVLGGFEGSFDRDVVVLVFIGSGFDNLNTQDQVMQDNFRFMKDVEIFKDNKAKYKALYVRELVEPFCDYWCKGIERLLCCQQEMARELTNRCFPKKSTMQTIVVHNDEKYGGAGYNDENMAVISTNQVANYLLIHELGHSLFNLGDEYAYSDSTADNQPNCDVAGCPKWADMGPSYCIRTGCKGGQSYVGRYVWSHIIHFFCF